MGFNLRLVQNGEMPKDWKPMTTIGSGVYEIRISTPDQYRVFYVASFPEGVYVLHAFSKRTRKTSQRDLNIGQERYDEVVRYRHTK
ncbi:MAG: type II toxin-antitoxin system RelE/ParE family toxin [Candidatus Kapaibacterium sp.]